MIYLDNSATTRVRPEVLDAMLPYLSDKFGNPSSVHATGREARAAVDKARGHVADLLGAKVGEIYFSGCGTLSNNVALLGRARFVQANDLSKHLIVSRIEHPSVMGPAQYLESQGFKVTYLDVDKEGFVDMTKLERALTGGASMVSIMWANNEIGVVQPIEEIGRLISKVQTEQEREIFWHTDAVQVIGKVPVDLSKLPVSSLSFSGHKFGAPKGIGVLYVRELVNVMPIIFGGGQEMGLMPGTEPLSNIVALGEAARLAKLELDQLHSRLTAMQERILKTLLAIDGVDVTGPLDISKRLPGHVSVSLNKAQGEGLVVKCDLKGVAVSSGSACHKGIIEASAVLKALGLSTDKALGAIRITIGRDNTEQDIDRACQVLSDVFSKASQAVAK